MEDDAAAGVAPVRIEKLTTGKASGFGGDIIVGKDDDGWAGVEVTVIVVGGGRVAPYG